MALDAESFDILLATVQRFVRERLVPAENHLEEHDEVPPGLVVEMKEMGLFGLTVPEEFGGIGLSVAQEVQVNFELGRTAPAFRSVFGTNIGIGSQGILMDGTPDQKADDLPRVASGELVMSFALTEPDAGSDAASLKTRAELDGDHYVLNGTKRFITNAPRAGAFTIRSRSTPNSATTSARSATRRMRTARSDCSRACSTLSATRRPTRRSSARWASSACSARRSPSPMAAPG